MDFQIFEMYLQNNILDWLPEAYMTGRPEVMWVDRMNGSYRGLTIRNDEGGPFPVVDLNALYERYQDGMPIEVVMQQAAQTLQMHTPELNLDAFDDYDLAKQSLSMRLCNAKVNAEQLQRVPHAVFGDIAVTYHLTLAKSDVGEHCCMITNELLEDFGVSIEQLHRDAAACYAKQDPAALYSLSEMMTAMYPGEDIPDTGIYVLTTEDRMFGAAALLQDGIMERVAGVLDADYYVVPLSIHEVLIQPDNGEVNWRDIEEIIQIMNQTVVPPNDRLSDTVYRFDSMTGELETAEHYEQRSSFQYLQMEAWGTVHDLCVEAGSYAAGNNLALQLYENSEYGMEPYDMMTVNLPDQTCAPDCAFINTDHLPVAPKMIAQYGLGEPTGRTAVSGFCEYPEYRFNLEEIKKYCMNPAELQERIDAEQSPENEKRREGRER